MLIGAPLSPFSVYYDAGERVAENGVEFGMGC